MGDDGGGGDLQKEKRAAAAAYDYDGDARWAAYWSNVLIPPHMSSRTDVVDHYKRKFYHRFIDPDFVVEAMPSAGSSQSARTTRSSSTPTRENARPPSSAPSSGTSAATERSSSSLRLDKQTIHFSVNAWVLVVALFGILPLVPSNLSSKAFRLSLLGTALSSSYSLYTLYGKPRAWNLPAVQTWLQSLVSTKDFIRFVYCIMLVWSRMNFKFALVPVLCWAVEHVAKFLRVNFSRSLLYRRYLQKGCQWVEANPSTLSLLCSNVEIALGFLLIISLVSWHRSILLTFMYWQLLKLMYHAPTTGGHHRSVWAKIGRAINPYVSRYAPFLDGPISTVRRWWLR
ncbi:hypothetical protein HPP92_003407 [Vanilla planifolia]|uniref:Uncharacterized protein n=1 Tax=Vanilla planifolia TaxID=51239 RepID=A0A835S914_VANPL|nr:hypothetical protein HPP92_003788 [Vanilla planifolia]KAG0503335.1 hypothetical protein HPP92_003407 [Vanilla planifolia]